MTDNSKTSAMSGTKVPKGRKLLSFREFVEAKKAGRDPVARFAERPTTIRRSKQVDTILRSVREAVMHEKTKRQLGMPTPRYTTGGSPLRAPNAGRLTDPT